MPWWGSFEVKSLLWYVADDMIMIYFDDIYIYNMLNYGYHMLRWYMLDRLIFSEVNQPNSQFFFEFSETCGWEWAGKGDKGGKGWNGTVSTISQVKLGFLMWMSEFSAHLSARQETGLGDQSFQGAGDLSALSGDAEDHSPSAAIWKSPLKENDLQIMFINFLSKNCQTCWRPRSGSSTPGTQRFHAELVLGVLVDTRIRCVANFENLAVALSCWADKANWIKIWLKLERLRKAGGWDKGLGVCFQKWTSRRDSLFRRSTHDFENCQPAQLWQEPPPMCAPKALMHATNQVCEGPLVCHLPWLDQMNGTLSDLQYHSAISSTSRYIMIHLDFVWFCSMSDCQMLMSICMGLLKNGGTLKSNTWWLLPSQKNSLILK